MATLYMFVSIEYYLLTRCGFPLSHQGNRRKAYLGTSHEEFDVRRALKKRQMVVAESPGDTKRYKALVMDITFIRACVDGERENNRVQKRIYKTDMRSIWNSKHLLDTVLLSNTRTVFACLGCRRLLSPPARSTIMACRALAALAAAKGSVSTSSRHHIITHTHIIFSRRHNIPTTAHRQRPRKQRCAARRNTTQPSTQALASRAGLIPGTR